MMVVKMKLHLYHYYVFPQKIRQNNFSLERDINRTEVELNQLKNTN